MINELVLVITFFVSWNCECPDGFLDAFVNGDMDGGKENQVK